MTRFILDALGFGLLAGLVGGGLAYYGLDAKAYMPFIVGGLAVMSMWFSDRFYRPKSLPAPPDAKRMHWHYLGLALAGTGMFAALVLLQRHESLPLFLLLLASMGLGLWLAARQNALRILYKQNPALFDERAQANQRRAEKWAFGATLEVAVILGWLDHEQIVALSGAFVGFGAAYAGVMAGLLMQAWLEWRDAR